MCQMDIGLYYRAWELPSLPALQPRQVAVRNHSRYSLADKQPKANFLNRRPRCRPFAPALLLIVVVIIINDPPPGATRLIRRPRSRRIVHIGVGIGISVRIPILLGLCSLAPLGPRPLLLLFGL